MTLSLSRRLLLGLLAVVVLGLVISDVLTYTRLNSFLDERLDQQLSAGSAQATAYLVDGGDRGRGPGGPGGGGPGAATAFPVGSYAELRSGSGAVLVQDFFGTVDKPSTASPQLPSGRLHAAGGDVPVFSTVPGSGGVARYRVLVEMLDSPSLSGDYLVLAIPTSDADSTLNQLLLLEVVITAVVLVGMAALSWWIIRIGLRPLERMGETAAAIAGGDLSRRVEPATSKTEIGKLGLALNAMLSQIETAFGERTRSEQRLRRFVADASHELRTPLTSIRGYAELLRRRPAPPPDDVALARRRIEEEAIRMSGLVNDMLLLARLDQGRPLERAPVDLRAVAADACADARAVAPGRDISLSADEEVVVDGDESRLRQVVGNLVRNALVHTPAASPVEVGLRTEGGRGVLVVVDHGRGLAPDDMERVFEPFYRADPGRSRDRGGSGLGLSIVAAVVAAHGGSVRAEETAGGGATFRVELPLAGSGSGSAQTHSLPGGRSEAAAAGLEMRSQPALPAGSEEAENNQKEGVTG